MGAKTRGNYPVIVCFKKCLNRDVKCKDCVAMREYKPIEGKSGH